MNIGETLKFFRKMKGFTQKEMLTKHVDPSTYSRIESNKRSIKWNDLQTILETMKIVPEEFFSLVVVDKEQEWYRETYYYCAEHPDDQSKKIELVTYYKHIEKLDNKNLKELSNFIAIKANFHLKWSEIGEITPSEISSTYKMLSKKKFYFQYDYILINNLITFFSNKQIDTIMAKAFPLQYRHKRDITTKRFANNIWINLISIKIYKEDYIGSKEYLKLANKYDSVKDNYYFTMNLRYLENLTLYMETGIPEYYEKILEFLHIIETIGDWQFANEVRNEIQTVTHNKKIAANDKKKYSMATIKKYE